MGRGRQDARGQWAVGGGHISVSPAKVPSPDCSRERGCRGGGVDRLPLQPALRAESGLTGRRAGTQSSHLTLLPPPSGLGPPKLNRASPSPALAHAMSQSQIRSERRAGGAEMAPAPQAESGARWGAATTPGCFPGLWSAEASGEPRRC